MDIWVDMQEEKDNSYINQHFDKIDKDLLAMKKASQATDMLSQSITLMEQLK